MKLNDKDIEIIEFIYNRLLEVYKENKNFDYMRRAKKTIKKIKKQLKIPILGHKELKTTQIYSKIMDKKKKEAMNKIPNINI